ncbi:MAG: hypothetical protein GY851_32630, partial [bacterium]|nr:hypothetical protein [bacterium]
MIGADAVIDDLHIHDRRFEASDVVDAMETAVDPPVRMIDTLAYGASKDVERSGMTILGDVVLPLTLNGLVCPRGFSMASGGTLSFPHDGTPKWLRTTVAVSSFAATGARCRFEVRADGEPLFASDAKGRDDQPLEIQVDLAGKRRIELRAVGEGMRHREALWAYPRLGNAEEEVAMGWSQALDEKRLDTYRRQLEADDYQYEIDSDEPWVVCAKHWADDVDVTKSPEVLAPGTALQVAAAPGEYEPVNFMVYAVDGTMDDVRVSVSDLKGDAGAIDADACNVRLVLRRLMRDLYTVSPDRSTVVSRFLLSNQPVDIPAGTFREYHLIVHVPQDQAPGSYRGAVSIAAKGGEKRNISLALNVRPMELGTPAPNAYGMYYRFPNDEDEWEGLQREFADIHEYGGRMLKWNVGVRYAIGEDGVVADVGRVRRGLSLLAKHGYEGPMPVNTGVETLARQLRYDPVADHEDEAARETFHAAVAKGMKALEQVAAEFPQFELMPTHMDEVFG